MNSIFLTILSSSIVCSFIILCVILLNKIFWKNYSRQWTYIVWIVIAFRLIIPVNINVIDIPRLLNLNGIVENIMPSADTERRYSNSNKSDNDLKQKNNQITTDVIDIEDNKNIAEVDKQQETQESYSASTNLPFPILDIITVIWVVGVILFLSYHLLAYIYYRAKLSRWSIAIKNNDILDQFHKLCIELDINHKITLVTSNLVSSPILVGIKKPCIVLPTKDFTMEQYNFILKHELIHYKNHDIFYKIILLCANALHWFNPLIHYMVYLANNDIELYCDEKLVANNNLLYRENYSKTLLQIMTGDRKNKNILISTGFSSKKKQLKKRFFQIMNSKPTKKGTCFIVSLVCLIVLVGNVIVWLAPAKISNADMNNTQLGILNAATGSNFTQDTNNPSDLLKEVNSILVVGIDGTTNEEHSRADSILVVSLNPFTKRISLTSFIRDMYLEIPNQGKGKLSSVYELGGTDLIKNTIETNFDLTIDHTVTVNMAVFESIINAIGGVNIELSKEEAEYLNKTNYISHKEYRNVITGMQKLNGNQALGYIRVRNVPTLQGEKGDFGRTVRLRSLLSSIMEEYNKEDINDLIKVVIKIVPSVSTDLSLNQILIYLNTVLQDDVNTNTISIPVEGSYSQKVEEGKSFLDLDLKENIEVLKQIYN